MSSAIPLGQYHSRVQQAISALDTLAQVDENESAATSAARIKDTLLAVRSAVPENETVEWDGTDFKVDNSWLHRELTRYERAPEAETSATITLITERLQALEQRLAEIQGARATGTTKAEAGKKLGEILQRPEYARNLKTTPFLTRLWRDFMKWLNELLPKPPTMQPGRASLFTKFAQFFVILLALAVLAYAVKLFAPRLLQKRRPKKKSKQEPRIVLGEKLEPDQSAVDLLADAEGLARRGELRAAIRKAYIALLVELGERKIISLAQHKTNRDYLGAVREREPLHTNVKQLTESFERHWYGFASATEADWLAFRAGYKTVTSDR